MVQQGTTHGKLCPLGQTESAQAARNKRDVQRTEHQVPGIDDAWYANAGSRPGVLYSDAQSRLRWTGPTDFILLTRSPQSGFDPPDAHDTTDCPARGAELGHNNTTDCARAWHRTGSHWCSRVQPFVRQSPHGKLCPLGQTEPAQAARYTRDVRRTEHQVPGIDDAPHANTGSRPGVLNSNARSRLREMGPTDFILLTRPPLCRLTLRKVKAVLVILIGLPAHLLTPIPPLRWVPSLRWILSPNIRRRR